MLTDRIFRADSSKLYVGICERFEASLGRPRLFSSSDWDEDNVAVYFKDDYDTPYYAINAEEKRKKELTKMLVAKWFAIMCPNERIKGKVDQMKRELVTEWMMPIMNFLCDEDVDPHDFLAPLEEDDYLDMIKILKRDYLYKSVEPDDDGWLPKYIYFYILSSYFSTDLCLDLYEPFERHIDDGIFVTTVNPDALLPEDYARMTPYASFEEVERAISMADYNSYLCKEYFVRRDGRVWIVNPKFIKRYITYEKVASILEESISFRGRYAANAVRFS